MHRDIYGGGSFRVEEYKKPEFEVTVEAPNEPVMLGEKITATIKAKYYFGSPVTKAKVKYKVIRTSYDEQLVSGRAVGLVLRAGLLVVRLRLRLVSRLAATGAACGRCRSGGRSGQQPPEVVAEHEVEIGADGTVKVEIDTAVAKAIHPTRTTATRSPPRWSTSRGARSSAPARCWSPASRSRSTPGSIAATTASATRSTPASRAQTLDGKPVEGKGELTLLQDQLRQGRQAGRERRSQTWKLDTNAEGTAQQQIKARRPGSIALSLQAAPTPSKHTIEGGYVFTVIGEGFDGADFRFNDLELIPDKREYAPGDKVKLQINTDRAGGTVLLFVRPANGVYLPPKVIRLEGKSTVEEIDVVKKDMPNFFVEAVTVADGKVYTETEGDRRAAGKAGAERRSPAVEGGVQAGREGQGEDQADRLHRQAVRRLDRGGDLRQAVEYISGGSNVPEIKEFFWKWRRQHNPQTESQPGPLVRQPDAAARRSA